MYEESAQGNVPGYCVPCQGNICYCEDKRQVTFFTSDEDEAVAEDTDSEVPGVDSQLHKVDNGDGAVVKDADSAVPGVDSQLHRVYTIKVSTEAHQIHGNVPGGEGNP